MRILPSLSLAAAVALGVSLLTTASPAAAGGATANDCVNVASATLSTGMTFDVKNACDKRLSCALTWTLSCENASGKVTSKAKQEAKFNIGAGDSHQMTGSSASCKDGWTIDDVAWDCASSSR